MAITKDVGIDRIEVVGTYKTVQYRKATIISEDGIEIGKSYTRQAFMPDADISSESAEVQAVCNAVWTDAVKAAYETWKDENKTPPAEE